MNLLKESYFFNLADRSVGWNDAPGCGNRGKSHAITTEDKEVRDSGVLHRVPFVPIRLIHVQPPDEHRDGGDDSERQRTAPYSVEMTRTEAAEMS